MRRSRAVRTDQKAVAECLTHAPPHPRLSIGPHAAGADLLSGFGGETAAAGTVSDMLTMSPGQNGDGDENNGGNTGAAPQRKMPIAADNDWLGFAGDGQGSAKAGATPSGNGSIAGGGSTASPASGSLLDDWASGGGGTKASEGVDRNLLLQKKVTRLCAVCIRSGMW